MYISSLRITLLLSLYIYMIYVYIRVICQIKQVESATLFILWAATNCTPESGRVFYHENIYIVHMYMIPACGPKQTFRVSGALGPRY